MLTNVLREITAVTGPGAASCAVFYGHWLTNFTKMPYPACRLGHWGPPPTVKGRS